MGDRLRICEEDKEGNFSHGIDWKDDDIKCWDCANKPLPQNLEFCNGICKIIKEGPKLTAIIF